MKRKLFILIFIVSVVYNLFSQEDSTKVINERNPYGYLIYDSKASTSREQVPKKEKIKNDTVQQTASVNNNGWNDPYIINATDSADYKYNRIRQGGLGYSKLQNEFLSPLTYAGINIRTLNTIEKKVKNTFRKRSLSIHYSMFLFSSTGNSMNEFGALYDYSYLVRVNKKMGDNFKLFIGPTSYTELAVNIKSDNTNNPYAYRYGHTFDLSGMVAYRFKTNRYLAVSLFVDLPILSLVSIPDYASMVSADYYENGGFFNLLSFKTIGNYTRLRTMLNIDFSFFKNSKNKSGSTWRVSYLFDGGSINEPRKLGFSSQVFMVGRVFRVFNL